MEETAFEHKGQQWKLSAGKAIYWKDERALIIADLHCGKSAHFRKAGIAVPSNLVEVDLRRLQQLITFYCPDRLIVVGDMFHSDYNNDIAYFKIWRQQFQSLQFELVNGNHDILALDIYDQLNISCYDFLDIQNIHFAHDPEMHRAKEKQYVLSGHLHPGVSISGAAKQSMRLPCFYFGDDYGVLPAFSRFTGMYTIKAQKSEPVFVVAENKIIRMQ
ncbi:metallophosphoesterase [Chitinophaga caeni]|uniref:Metallophosphoesterase n=1 Tax=Chitinophaga caeni TaxID=2029983 RepID=A0A291QPD3_9BACT|nr:ligase-associated DNA damage response endonuclease PdeM [Chitinophaga caeni]ATL45787.1 metallophosphoesterase [Chitinophaga caeni]